MLRGCTNIVQYFTLYKAHEVWAAVLGNTSRLLCRTLWSIKNFGFYLLSLQIVSCSTPLSNLAADFTLHGEGTRLPFVNDNSLWELNVFPADSGVPRIFFRGGDSTNSVEDRGQRGRGSEGGGPLVRGSGGSCNLVQEISFHIVKFS